MSILPTSSRSLASIAAAVLGSAAAVALAPTAAVLAVLVAGMALLGIAFHARQRRLDADVRAIVHSLDRIAGGVFEGVDSTARTPQAAQIGSAVQSMAEHIKTRFEHLQESAQRDPLTGMANRAHFRRMVERQLEQRAPGSTCCLMFVDIDGFKDVNDTLGHNLGDRLLQCIADRLKIATRIDELLDERGSGPPAETRSVDEAAPDRINIARFGGDEFVIFMNGLASETPARKMANRILRVLVEPFELSTHVAGVSASIGMAFVPDDAVSYGDLLRAADAAMYHAKRSGRNRVERFTPALEAELQHQISLERDLREALARDEFELHYQPQYDCRTLQISSAEALIRWRHPTRGLVSPAEFIPLAEKSNLICEIGEWVVREAARTIADLERQGRPLRISVNVSPQQLEQMEFVSLVKSSLLRSHATPRLLEIEITESMAMRDCEMAAERLGRLADLGVSIAIDDFGTGYSNLASLIRLPVSRLKIDRSLLEDITCRPEVGTLVQTIISMANGLGFHSVAEGVENAEQLHLLSSMGCDVVQGFFLSRPITRAALEQLLSESIYREELCARLTAVAS